MAIILATASNICKRHWRNIVRPSMPPLCRSNSWRRRNLKKILKFKVNNKDAVFIFSVGGGDLKKKVSVNIIRAIEYAKKRKCRIFSILGRKNSYTYKNSNICILAKTTNKKLITPLSESYQAIIWHCIISHPSLMANKTKW